jgi:23S rRNA (uracil1939-C5)-methyltransferase
MKDVLNADFVAEHGKPDVIITDPPRAGMHPDVVNRLMEIEAAKIVYVSCNAATQARDLIGTERKIRYRKNSTGRYVPAYAACGECGFVNA